MPVPPPELFLKRKSLLYIFFDLDMVISEKMGGFRDMGGYIEMAVTENGWLQQEVGGYRVIYGFRDVGG
jgi:hypothetical protein